MEKLERDKSLLTALAKNDSACAETIYRENFLMVRQMVVTNAGSEDDAADVFQDGMIVLFEKAGNPDFELTCQLKTFLYSICRRLWLKKLQQKGKHISIDIVEEMESVEVDLQVHEEKQRNFNLMDATLQKIGEPCKSLLEAYYINKKHMHDIAADFGYTNADNAKTQKYKCLMRLKKLFFAQYKN